MTPNPPKLADFAAAVTSLRKHHRNGKAKPLSTRDVAQRVSPAGGPVARACVGAGCVAQGVWPHRAATEFSSSAQRAIARTLWRSAKSCFMASGCRLPMRRIQEQRIASFTRRLAGWQMQGSATARRWRASRRQRRLISPPSQPLAVRGWRQRRSARQRSERRSAWSRPLSKRSRARSRRSLTRSPPPLPRSRHCNKPPRRQ